LVDTRPDLSDFTRHFQERAQPFGIITGLDLLCVFPQ